MATKKSTKTTTSAKNAKAAPAKADKPGKKATKKPATPAAPQTPQETQTTPETTPVAPEATTTTVDAGGGIMVDIVEATTPVEAKPARTPKAPREPQPEPEDGKMSGLDAAAKVLAENGVPMKCKDIVEQMLAKGYWTTGGKTPAATLYSAMLREIDTKPGESRFAKTGRGLFALAKV